jgi:hypothetical protein
MDLKPFRVAFIPQDQSPAGTAIVRAQTHNPPRLYRRMQPSRYGTSMHGRTESELRVTLLVTPAYGQPENSRRTRFPPRTRSFSPRRLDRRMAAQRLGRFLCQRKSPAAATSGPKNTSISNDPVPPSGDTPNRYSMIFMLHSYGNVQTAQSAPDLPRSHIHSTFSTG